MTRKARGFLLVACAIAGAMIAVNLLGNLGYMLGGLRVKLSAQVGVPGQSRLVVPPIGYVQARTHAVPVRFVLTLEDIDPGFLEEFLANGETPSELWERLEKKAGGMAANFVAWLVAVGALGGAVAAALGLGRQGRVVARGGAIGALSIAVLLGATYTGFDRNRFKNPEYGGIIEAAPWMLGLVDRSLVKAGEFSRSMEGVVESLSTIFQRVSELEPFQQNPEQNEDGFVRVLQVSDIHNNPAAMNFVDQVTKNFKVDLIVDTGDLTDFGTPMEMGLARGIENLGIPYIFVSGNHDSQEVLNRLEKYKNVILLGGKVVTVKGITIAGIDDPATKTGEIAVASLEELELAQTQLDNIIRKSGKSPTIVAVHNRIIGEPFIGKVPLLLHGHDHQFRVGIERGTVVVDAGTTGGAGLRGFTVKGGVPYSVALIHLSKTSVVAVDTIKISGLRQEFTLERKLIEISKPSLVKEGKALSMKNY